MAEEPAVNVEIHKDILSIDERHVHVDSLSDEGLIVWASLMAQQQMLQKLDALADAMTSMSLAFIKMTRTAEARAAELGDVDALMEKAARTAQGAWGGAGTAVGPPPTTTTPSGPAIPMPPGTSGQQGTPIPGTERS